MTRTETIGDAVLYLGDCREIVPTLGKVDAVVTDPPYGIGFEYESHVDDPNAYGSLMREVIAALPVAGPCAFWQSMLNADRWHEWFPKGFRIFAACKSFVQYRPTPLQWSWDPVIIWGKPWGEPQAGRRDWHVQMTTMFGAGRERVAHPCPRPTDQVGYVIECLTLENHTILDPFMGSGTTGVAALKLGRKFIGIEIEPRYFDIACRRIEEAWKQPRLFDDLKPKAVQERLDL